MSKNACNFLGRLFKSEKRTEKLVDSDVKKSPSKEKKEDYSQFAYNLCLSLIGGTLDIPTPEKFIQNYISEYGLENFFNALKYIFAINNQEPSPTNHCSLIRNSREDLCEILIDLKVTPIHTWLKIISYNYNDELYYEDLSIEYLCDNIPEDVLIPFVLEDFENILKRTKPSDYYYFSKYKEWQEYFCANIVKTLAEADFNYVDEYLDIAKYFPECALNVYEFILVKYYEALEKGNLYMTIWSPLSIVEDILLPMADIYIHFGKKSAIITVEFLTHFLSAIDNKLTILFHAQYIFENYFDISPKLLDAIAKSNVRRYIKKLIIDKISAEQYSITLNGILSHQYAYDCFMDNIDKILHRQGIEFYACLVKKLGYNQEVENAKYCCFEYD